MKSHNQIGHNQLLWTFINHLIFFIIWVTDWTDGGNHLFGLKLNLTGYLLNRQYPQFSGFIVSSTYQNVFPAKHVPNVLLNAIFSNSGHLVRFELIKFIISLTCVIPDVLFVCYCRKNVFFFKHLDHFQLIWLINLIFVNTWSHNHMNASAGQNLLLHVIKFEVLHPTIRCFLPTQQWALTLTWHNQTLPIFHQINRFN